MLRNVRCLPDYDGSPALLIVGHDITELKAAQERALQSERLAAIGQMVAGLAHESRNALQRSQACLEMLALQLEDRPAAAQPDRPHPAGPGRPPPPLRGRPRVRGPDQAGHPRVPARRGLAARPGRTSSRSATAGTPSLHEPSRSLNLTLPGRPVPARAGLPQHPGQRPGRVPRSRRDPDRGRRRPRSTAGRRSGSRSATTGRGSTPSSATRSSTRSTPPRPRGPAWAWPSPSGSSRPTAAGSASASRRAGAPRSSSPCRENRTEP